ncbi:UBX domain-containing protein 8 isoform X3 [Sminthopsis crassicaudata]|uniref:UBX domain-containing protein 8 isoform X3 n=1 Tax=Sminthopsis crassicaudata TaxID=9301 RepID=UPI003D681BB6
MAARTAWLLLAIPAVPLLCLQLRSAGLNPGWKDIFLLGGRGLLFLAILTLIILVTTPWLTPQAPEVCLTVTEDENKRRQKRVREKQQETLSTKSSGYLKNVLKPRQETKLRKQEESFYQMMGETWKSLDGYKLGGYEEPSVASENGVPDDTPNREASRRRKLPEHVNHAPASPEQPRAKKVASPRSSWRQRVRSKLESLSLVWPGCRVTCAPASRWLQSLSAVLMDESSDGGSARCGAHRCCWTG